MGGGGGGGGCCPLSAMNSASVGCAWRKYVNFYYKGGEGGGAMALLGMPMLLLVS